MALSPLAATRTLNRPHAAAFPAALYAIFGAADLFFSLVAFSRGVAEGNPFMAWLLERGLFLSGKIALTVFVVVLMLVVLGRSRQWRWVGWGGVGIMAGVTLLHMWALTHLPLS